MNPLGFYLFKWLSHYSFDVIYVPFALVIILAPYAIMMAQLCFWPE